MALSGGCHPDHSTLAHFVSSMQKEIESLFTNILLVCEELDLLGGTHFSLDGVKLPSNASKEWSGTFKELKKKRNKLQGKTPTGDSRTHPPGQDVERGHRKHQHQEQRLLHQVERLNEFLQEEQPKIGKSRKEIQSNVTDNESAKMPTSHGVIQGYNAQALVDGKHQVIVQAETFSSQDQENLAPMLAGAKKNMQAIGKPPDYFQGKQFTCGQQLLLPCQSGSLPERKNWTLISRICSFASAIRAFSKQQRFKNGIHPRTRSAKRETKFTDADFRLR